MDTTKWEEQIEEIIKFFDWVRVHKVMQHLDWKWHSAEFGVPTIGEMIITSTRLMKDAVKEFEMSNEYVSVSTGGFEAVIFQDKTLKLSFEVTDWVSDPKYVH